ncbi:MAG TPA: hypothetical protein VHA13_02430 [Gammaproteobacteria bacterium]|nr:hypothetical protein [Gammaproteobacteria bacterium]
MKSSRDSQEHKPSSKNGETRTKSDQIPLKIIVTPPRETSHLSDPCSLGQNTLYFSQESIASAQPKRDLTIKPNPAKLFQSQKTNNSQVRPLTFAEWQQLRTLQQFETADSEIQLLYDSLKSGKDDNDLEAEKCCLVM